MNRKPAILLSHHRTGSTAIRHCLSSRLAVFPGEPLLPFLADVDSFSWDGFFCDCKPWRLLHLHRHHVDLLNGWGAVAEHAGAIIHLTRQRRIHQALSLRRAIVENNWHENQRGHSHGDAIALDDLIQLATEWAAFEARAEFYFRDLPGLWISYEEFCRDPEQTIERIGDFLEGAI